MSAGYPFLSLRGRLAVLVAVIAATVIAIESYLEIRTFEGTVREDRLQAAAATAQAVADDLELRGSLDAPAEIGARLHEFLDATPTLREITVLRLQGGTLSVLARTSSVAAEPVAPAARQAVDRHALVWTGGGDDRVVAAPVVRQGRMLGAVAVGVSLAPVERLGAHGRRITLWFAIPAIFLLTVLVDLLAQRLVHGPIKTIRDTMREAGEGRAGARARVERPDEIGEVARGLNDMLGRLEQLQAGLQARVDEATRQLRETNARLVESYQRTLGLREALARREQMAALGQLAASVAHQVGTPLNLISGYVQVMMEEARDDPSARHRLQTLEAQIRKVAEAVRTMLDCARRPVLQREAVDVAALVERVCEMSTPALHAASVDLRRDVQRPLPWLSVDPAQLELALFNLVSNSLDAMPEGGRLEILASATPGGVRLVVADSGTGIPPEILPRIFEPWVTTKPAGRGTGLGLSITRDTIAAHGGRIDVRSEPGRGTVFTIDLPADAADARGGAEG